MEYIKILKPRRGRPRKNEKYTSSLRITKTEPTLYLGPKECIRKELFLTGDFILENPKHFDYLQDIFVSPTDLAFNGFHFWRMYSTFKYTYLFGYPHNGKCETVQVEGNIHNLFDPHCKITGNLY